MVGAMLAFVALACERSPVPSAPVGDELPGAQPRSAELEARLRTAIASEAPADRARIRHRRPDGSPRFTNRLVLERSPYLRQHAHNPVDWFPWSDEAFTRARAERKLVLLSVGYATCHWCHVMEEESFEDEIIAARLNADYVAVKVDREERPDVDGTYIRAVAALTGNAGWPMTVWMTSDRDILFAGTYFPPRDGTRGAGSGFLSLLEYFAEAARRDPAGLRAEGRRLAARLERQDDLPRTAAMPGRAVLDAAFAQYESAFDHQHGGFGRAPKFPMPSVLDFLLRYYRRTRTPAALEMAERTLGAMAEGGIRDHLGGAFHRYAIDRSWHVPHFEKMLYDNAQLAGVYLAAWQATGRDQWRDVVRGILDDVLATLRAPGGGLHAAIDADDPAGEGAYYTWTVPEVNDLLDFDSAAVVRARWGIAPPGDVEGRSVLRVARSWEQVATEVGVDEARAMQLVADARASLFRARMKRAAPRVDDKVLAGWNGLAITAFARAGAALGEPRYLAAARDAAEFVFTHMTSEGKLFRVHARGSTGQAGFVDDYAFLIAGLLDLFDATSDLRWLDVATRLQVVLDREFWDRGVGGYFESADGTHDPRLPRVKPHEDGALPSGNAVAIENLVRLAVLHGDDDVRRRAEQCLRAFAPTLTANPTAAPRLAGALEASLDRVWEIVIVAPPAAEAAWAGLLRAVHDRYLPNRVLVVAREGRDLGAVQQALPLVGEKTALGGVATAYVCERGRCLQPTSDPAILGGQLDVVLPLPPEPPGD